MMFIDSHAHITSNQFDADREEVIQRALDAGVGYIVNPGTDLDDSKRAIDLAEKYPNIYACVGFHPHDAKKADDDSLRQIEELSNHPKVVAIGEIGLDFHYDFSPRDVQERVFRAQIEIAQRRNLPIVIHTRESIDQTIQIVEEAIGVDPLWRSQLATLHSRNTSPKGVFHCFPGDVDLAWKVINLGFFVSLPGVVTFKNPGFAADIAANISIEHLLLETDSPYLAPVPMRGKRNEPSIIPVIAEKIATLQGLTIEDVARATNYNMYKLFEIGEVGKPVYTYPMKKALYINLTIRCNADCVFCDRKGEAVIKGQNLRITREPSVQEIILEIGDPQKFTEIVFCGFGEPTIRLDAVKEISRWVKMKGGKTRLNTDGHGDIINKRNIVPELVGLIDAVSISLNSPDPIQYGELMRLDGEKYFATMKKFAKECVRLLPRVVMTAVDLDEVSLEQARQIVEQEIGAKFSVRPYF